MTAAIARVRAALADFGRKAAVHSAIGNRSVAVDAADLGAVLAAHDDAVAHARRSAVAAVDAARELGAVASQAREALRELLTATVERDEAEAAHTNAGSPAARQRMMREAGTARQRYTDAVDAAARALGVDVGALRAARAARLGALDGGR